MRFSHLILILFFSFSFGPLLSETPTSMSEIQIIDTSSNKNVSWKEIIAKMDQNEILIWGEEHEDSDGHTAQLDFLKKLVDFYPTALSLEMLEKDQQSIIDEYSRGFISEKQMLSSIPHWKNFATDYLPLVKQAKESYVPIVCANPPRRYVNAVARKGLLAYSDFSEDAYRYVPSAYTLGIYQSDSYLAKLRAMFQEEHVSPAKQPMSSESMILAQYMWDQGMAESVSRESYKSGRKIFHINGRFHSDEGGGVAYRLKQMGHKVLVLSVFPEGKEENQKFQKIADFVILTKRR